MWKQLTQRARKAILVAQEEAEWLGYNQVGPEHLLLALIRQDDCVAARILERLGNDLGTVRQRLMKNLSRGSEPLEIIALTPQAKRVIDCAFAEGKQMQQDWIGTEHLLMGLVQGDGTAARVLSDMGVDVPSIRMQLLGMRASSLPFDAIEGRGTVSLLGA